MPVITSILVRDTAEIFEAHELDPEAVVDQARAVLEDTTIASWKVGFLGSADGVSAVAEILSDCAYLLVASCGQSPRKSLQAAGLTVIVAEGGVDGLVDKLYGGGKKPRGKK